MTNVEPPWEACKECGGDHWTREHPTDAPAATTGTSPPAAAAARSASASVAATTVPSVEEIWLEPWPDSKGDLTWVCRRCRVAANHMSWCEVPATIAAAHALDDEMRAILVEAIKDLREGADRVALDGLLAVYYRHWGQP
jgi:hypothetical protein